MTLVLYLVLGSAAGVLSGLFGIGGGVIMVFGMVSLFRVPFPTATGTSLAAMLLPVGALGAYEYWRNGHLDLRAAGLLAAGLFVGAWVGARMANDLAPATLQRGFALFMLVMAVRMWITAG